MGTFSESHSTMKSKELFVSVIIPDYIGAAIYRKSAFRKAGLFDTTLKFGEDSDWFNRANELNLKVKRLEDVTLMVRRHGKNMTHGKDLVELNTLKVFKKFIDRKRAGTLELQDF